VSVSKYGKKSGQSEDRSSKKKGVLPFRQMAIALASETAGWIFPGLKGKEKSPRRTRAHSLFP